MNVTQKNISILISFVILLILISDLLFPQEKPRVFPYDTTSVVLNQQIHLLDNRLKSIEKMIDSTHISMRQSEDRIIQKIKDSQDPWSKIIPIIVAFLAGLLALIQVKANLISSARIQWIENLRQSVSELISEVDIINYHLRDVKILAEQKNTRQARTLFQKKISETKNLRNLAYKVKLYLNVGEENHRKLNDKLDEYSHLAIEDYECLDNTTVLLNVNSQVVELARVVLKDAWEDSKTINLRDILRIRLGRYQNPLSRPK